MTYLTYFRPESVRYSTGSLADTPPQQAFDQSTYESSYNTTAPRPRYDSNQLLMLPAPLSVSGNRPQPTSASASASTTALSRSSEEGGYASDMGSGSAHQRLIPSPPQEQHPYQEEYSSTNAGRYAQNPQFEARVSRTAGAHSGVLRQPTASQHQPVEQYNPYGYSQPYSAGYDEPQVPFVSEPEEMISPISTASAYASRTRGVSLSDNGPVPGPAGVRRVSRQTGRRPTSQAPPQNRYSRSSTAQFPNLPPGAAPPSQGYGY